MAQYLCHSSARTFPRGHVNRAAQRHHLRNLATQRAKLRTLAACYTISTLYTVWQPPPPSWATVTLAITSTFLFGDSYTRSSTCVFKDSYTLWATSALVFGDGFTDWQPPPSFSVTLTRFCNLHLRFRRRLHTSPHVGALNTRDLR